MRTLAAVQLNALLDARATARLVAAFGGQTLHLAKRADDPRYQPTGAKLTRLLGPEAAEQLRRQFAGESVRFPVDNRHLVERDQRIQFLLEEGRTIAEICRTCAYVARPSRGDVLRVAREAGIEIAPHRARKAPANGNENQSQVPAAHG